MIELNVSQKIKRRGAILLLALLFGCGDNYPEMGKFSDKSGTLKGISQHSTVYALDPDEFKQWKSELEQMKDFSTLSENDLLAIQTRFAKSNVVNKVFEKNQLLISQPLNIDNVVNETISLNGEKLEKSEQKLSTYKQKYAALKVKKENADKSKAILDSIRKDFDDQLKALDSELNVLKLKSVNIHQGYNKGDLGLRDTPENIINRGKSFGYITFDNSAGLSCKDYTISKNNWRRKYYATFLFAEPLNIGEKTYCPVFETLGRKVKQKQSVLTSLSSDEKSTLVKAATAFVTQRVKSKAIKTKVKQINKDNPAVYAQAKSFSYQDGIQLRSYKSDIDASLLQNFMLMSLTPKKIKENKLRFLATSLAQAKGYYAFESLQDRLDKESVIQPDGTFKLASAEDYYLIELNIGKIADPKLARFAVVRMKQFNDTELVQISSGDFFSFDDLAKITL